MNIVLPNLTSLHEDLSLMKKLNSDCANQLIAIEIERYFTEILAPHSIHLLRQLSSEPNAILRVTNLTYLLGELYQVNLRLLQTLSIPTTNSFAHQINILFINCIFNSHCKIALRSLLVDLLDMVFEYYYHKVRYPTANNDSTTIIHSAETSILVENIRLLAVTFHGLSILLDEIMEEFISWKYTQLLTAMHSTTVNQPPQTATSSSSVDMDSNSTSSHTNIIHFLDHHQQEYLAPFFCHIYPHRFNYSKLNCEEFLRSTAHYATLAHRCYYTICVRDLFDVIVDFPYSTHKLLALRKCVDKLSKRVALVEDIQFQLSQRLLQPGASTANILEAYINAVRSFLILDPSGLLLEALYFVATYLRDRGDTVKCILDLLLNDDGSLFQCPLSKDPTLLTIQSVDDIEEINMEVLQAQLHWCPEPIESIYFHNNWRKNPDLLNQLVSIYGNKDRFINQFKSMLAQRLLSRTTFDTYTDLRHLEMLKSRFGEEHMHDCRVMIHDVDSSKRICNLLNEAFIKGSELVGVGLSNNNKDVKNVDEENNKSIEMVEWSLQKSNSINGSTTTSATVSSNTVAPPAATATTITASLSSGSSSKDVQGDSTAPTDSNLMTLTPPSFPISSFIISDQFWPQLKDDDMPLPEALHQPFHCFKNGYERLKGNRTLIWQSQLGSVNIEIQLPGSLEFLQMDVSPIMAIVIHCYLTKSTWSVQELALHLRISISAARRACLAWKLRGILTLASSMNDDVFTLCGAANSTLTTAVDGEGSNSVGDGASASAAAATRGGGGGGCNYDMNNSVALTNDTMYLEEEDKANVSDRISSEAEQVAQQEQVFWAYIKNMLTNRGEMDLTHIHSVLRMFAAGGNWLNDCNIEDVRRFLDAKVRCNLLVNDGDKYRMP